MSTSINLSLTSELKKFVTDSAGEDTLYSTPSEFIRELIREKKKAIDAAELRNAIIEGYSDAIEGHVIEYKGSLNEMLQNAPSNK